MTPDFIAFFYLCCKANCLFLSKLFSTQQKYILRIKKTAKNAIAMKAIIKITKLVVLMKEYEFYVQLLLSILVPEAQL
jgi:hypothetical protein